MPNAIRPCAPRQEPFTPIAPKRLYAATPANCQPAPQRRPLDTMLPRSHPQSSLIDSPSDLGRKRFVSLEWLPFRDLEASDFAEW